MANLNTTDMEEAATVFTQSLNHVLSNYLTESSKSVKEFVTHIVLKEKPYMMITEEGLPHIVELVFMNEIVRDFVLTLSSVFFSRWGNNDEQVLGLAGNIARGVSVLRVGDNVDIANSVIPRQISERLMTEEMGSMLLYNNRWLICLLMLQIYVNFDIPALPKKPK
jgi:hypothetical protein